MKMSQVSQDAFEQFLKNQQVDDERSDEDEYAKGDLDQQAVDSMLEELDEAMIAKELEEEDKYIESKMSSQTQMSLTDDLREEFIRVYEKNRIPTEEDLDELHDRSGYSHKQITKWFHNHYARNKQHRNLAQNLVGFVEAPTEITMKDLPDRIKQEFIRIYDKRNAQPLEDDITYLISLSNLKRNKIMKWFDSRRQYYGDPSVPKVKRMDGNIKQEFERIHQQNPKSLNPDDRKYLQDLAHYTDIQVNRWFWKRREREKKKK